MKINPLLKTAAGFFLVAAITPQANAQGPSWWQRIMPHSQYTTTNRAQYQYPQYQQQYQTYPQYQQNQQPSVRPATRPQARQKGYSPQDNRWYGDFNSAWSQAQKEGRPLITLIVHHGCPACDRMDGVLAKPGAMQNLASAVKVRMEFSDNPTFISQHNVKYTPTLLIFSPTTGEEVYREEGALTLNRLQSLKPSIDSLVTGPPKKSRSSRADSGATSSNKEQTADVKSLDADNASVTVASI